MLFGAATDAFWVSNRCYLGAFSFFCEKSVGLFSLGHSHSVPERRGAVPRFNETTQNTRTTTKHRNDNSNMEKKIPSGSGDGGGSSKKVFECICICFYK